MTEQKTSTSEALVDVQAVAKMLGCSAQHVRRLSEQGKMPAPIRLGARLIRWSPRTILDWIQAQTV
jgi:predicted DNA-binding transcriptional regulator AlpA